MLYVHFARVDRFGARHGFKSILGQRRWRRVKEGRKKERREKGNPYLVFFAGRAGAAHGKHRYQKLKLEFQRRLKTFFLEPKKSDMVRHETKVVWGVVKEGVRSGKSLVAKGR